MAQAMPAKPGWQTITQSDGTTLQVQTVGNAFNSAILTTDGLMVQRGADGDFYYRSSITGLTAVRAHNVDQRTATEAAFIGAQRESLTMKAKNRPMLRPKGGNMLTVGGSNAESGVPALGQRHIPIILVEFKDKKFNNTREGIIQSMLTGNKSVGQYFRDQSNGLYEPEFDVYGIYTLSQNREYYGGHSGNDNDKALGAMVTEACQMASAAGVSFKQFDTNSDDYCDVVIVIYAGVGEAQASTTHPEAIWPCNWNLSSAAYYGQGGNGAFRPKSSDPYIDTFAVFNELHGSNDETTVIDGIGTFCHEFGHCLGLPDFYDTAYGGHYGMGYWDIMCSGCYNDDTYTPVGYSAYEKVFMGWIEYITPTPGTYYTLPVWNQKNAATDKAVCIVSDLNPNEYFILENRSKQGWDRYISGQGILITHVTFNAERWWYDTPNNQDIQLMTIMPADNTLSIYDESTDVWPQSGKTEFTNNTTPAAKLNMTADGNISGNAGYLGKPVTQMVVNADGTAGFWYMKDAVTTPTLSVSTQEVNFGDVRIGQSEQRTITVHGNHLTNDVTLFLSQNTINDCFTLVTPITISKEEAENGCQVTVAFNPIQLGSASTTLSVTSTGAQAIQVQLSGNANMEAYDPVMQPVNTSMVDLTKFCAEWADQTPADNVLSYTLEVRTKPSFTMLESVDFSDVPDGLSDDGQQLIDVSGLNYLPDGWTCVSPMYAYSGYLITAKSISTKAYNLAGYGKVTVDLTASSYYENYYGTATIEVSTSKDSQTITLGADFDVYTIVLDCDDNDVVTIKCNQNFMAIRGVQIYAGERDNMLNASETSNGYDSATYRLVTDIVDKFYTVRDLQAGGTFIYKVKALYADGTESPWSNIEEVTLFANEHAYQRGDVNHDYMVDINDVTTLIDYVLGKDPANCCPICADYDENQDIDINDVTAVIDKVLGKR